MCKGYLGRLKVRKMKEKIARKESLARWVWTRMTTFTNLRRLKREKKEKALVDNLKNHRSDLCEACQKGSCSLNRSNNYTTSEYSAPNTTSYEREDYNYDDYYD